MRNFHAVGKGKNAFLHGTQNGIGAFTKRRPHKKTALSKQQSNESPGYEQQTRQPGHADPKDDFLKKGGLTNG